MPSKKQILRQLQGEWAAAEISVSYKPGFIYKKSFNSIDEIYKIVKSNWNKELLNLQEQFMALYLNKANQLIGWRLLNTGNIQTTIVDMRLLASLALHCMACSVIVVHNHPSGNLKPSKIDEQLTIQIKKILRLIDVKLFDHLIISSNGYFSMNEQGFM